MGIILKYDIEEEEDDHEAIKPRDHESVAF